MAYGIEEFPAFSVPEAHYGTDQEQEPTQHHIRTTPLQPIIFGILWRSPAFFSDRDLKE